MMPFVPFVAAKTLHTCRTGSRILTRLRHTSLIHSRNVRHMTRMGREMDTTLFIKNGPCMAGLGFRCEGYLSFSIALQP